MLNYGFINKLYTELKNYWLVWTIAFIVFFLFSLYIYENRSTFIDPREIEHTVVDQKKSEMTIGEITGNMEITQSFVAEQDQFMRIKIPFGTYNRQLEGNFAFELIDVDSEEVILKRDLPLNELQDGLDYNIDFPIVRNAKGKEFRFTITGQGLNPGNTATIWRSSKDDYMQGNLIINGRDMQSDLRFKVMDVETKPLLSKTKFVMFGISILIVFILSVVVLRVFKDKIHKAFLITAIPIGLAMVVIIPPFDQLDELEHYYRAFEVSEGKFINQKTEHGLGNFIPASLIETVYDVRYIHQTGYKYSIVKEAFQNNLNSEDRQFLRNYASSYPPLIYVPQALGMMVGRVIFDSPLMMMFLGRLLNFIAYVAIVYAALKIVPVKKNLFYLFAMLPMSIIHAASLSADGITNAMALFFVAYILYLAYGRVEHIANRHLIIMIGIGLFVTLSKIVYIPMLLVFLLIPLRKFKNKKDYLKKFLIVFVGCLIPFIIWNLMNLSNMSVPDMRGNPGVSPGDQVKFVLLHPMYYIKTLFVTLFSLGSSQLVSMIGKVATNYQYPAPSIVIYTFLFLMLLFGIINDENDLKMKGRRIDRGILIFILLTVMLLIYTAMYVGYNTVGNPIIYGIQGRYFVPIAILFFLSISNYQIINKNNDINLLIQTIIHCCMYALLFSYLVTING
ncbi:DUF2142 domain-containing protein [Bacillus sp. OK048]|uniref:DUF2142 domain-containing protein n=1 Tax=Bacillus sp. OK048 TaxID=1882761 RepID=UPI000880BD6E|nr:DUF2142 domain-containing protein [Bacillus sp. OK048]SDM70079.1 Uncharacterized membrane protein [Bacillus sp. OK048]